MRTMDSIVGDKVKVKVLFGARSRSFVQVIQANPWRYASAVSFLVGAVLLTLDTPLRMATWSDRVWMTYWLVTWMSGVVTVCVPSHRVIWSKVPPWKYPGSFQRSWFADCKNTDDVALKHDVTGDIVDDYATGNLLDLDLLHEIAEYEHTSPDALGHLATGHEYFPHSASHRALLNPNLPDQIIREILEGPPDENNTRCSLVLMKERERLLPMAEMLRLIQRHPSIEVRNAAKRRYHGDFAAFEPNPREVTYR